MTSEASFLTLQRLDPQSESFPDDLLNVLRRQDFDGYIGSLPTNDLMIVIDYLDYVHSPPTPAAIH